MIETKRGRIAVENIVVGDEVLSYDFDMNKFEALLNRLEASKKMETIMKAKGAPVVKDEQKVRSLVGSKFLKWLGDGYYERKLKKGGKVVKRMYGSA